MVTRRKPPAKAEPIDISARLSEALAEKPTTEGNAHQDATVVGDIVTVGNGKSELRVTKVYDDGREVNLELPGTNLERFWVLVADLNFVERQPRSKPKERRPSRAPSSGATPGRGSGHRASLLCFRGPKTPQCGVA